MAKRRSKQAIDDDFSGVVFRQHVGGKANFDGIAFQIFASAVTVARFAARACRGMIDDVYLVAEAPDSRVEDLHVLSDLGLRWHYQMKSSQASSWDAKLVEQFNHDHELHPLARLILVTNGRERAEAMWKGKELAGLPFAFVDWVPFDHADQAHRLHEIRTLLDELAETPNSEDSYYAGWRNLLGAWSMAFRGRISMLLHNAAVGSQYSIRQLQKPSAEVVGHLEGQTTVELELKVSKSALIVSDGVISTIVPLFNQDGDHLRDWETLEFHNPWHLYESLGAFKKEIG